MTSLLVQFMWLDACAYWLDMLIAGVVSVVLWHFICKGCEALKRWVWGAAHGAPATVGRDSVEPSKDRSRGSDQGSRDSRPTVEGQGEKL